MTKLIRPIYRKMIAKQQTRRGLEAFGAGSTGDAAADVEPTEKKGSCKKQPKTE